MRSPPHTCEQLSFSLGRGLSLPPGATVPEVIQRALQSAPAERHTRSNRESVQRKRHWWLPYVVLEFDKNEILIDALDGDLGAPSWKYRAHLCVALPCVTRTVTNVYMQRCVAHVEHLRVDVPAHAAVYTGT